MKLVSSIWGFHIKVCKYEEVAFRALVSLAAPVWPLLGLCHPATAEAHSTCQLLRAISPCSSNTVVRPVSTSQQPCCSPYQARLTYRLTTHLVLDQFCLQRGAWCLRLGLPSLFPAALILAGAVGWTLAICPPPPRHLGENLYGGPEKAADICSVLAMFWTLGQHLWENS